MKRIIFLLSLSTFLFSCGSNNNQQPNQGNNVTIQSTALPGFNVNNFANLVKKTNNPSAIESAINAPDNDINNLDLDKDGKVDFLKVVESPNRLQVVDEVNNNDSVTVATLNITPNQTNDAAEMHIQGNPTYCGPDYNYHSSFSIGELLLLSYMLRPHRYYYPVYHYGYYPSYYHGYSTTTYRTVTHTYNSAPSGSGVVRSAASTRSSLSNPVRSQRSFTARDASTPVRSGGFGTSSSSSGRSGFGSGSSRSSFGSGRSSFGGSRSGFGRRR